MTWETTQARAEAEAAERNWKIHRRECSRCTQAARSHQYGNLCGFGASIYQERREMQEHLAENRRLDNLPIADQLPLF